MALRENPVTEKYLEPGPLANLTLGDGDVVSRQVQESWEETDWDAGWTQRGATADISKDTANTTDGGQSVKFSRNENADKYLSHDGSVADSPTQMTVLVDHIQSSSTNEEWIGASARWQNVDNFYFGAVRLDTKELYLIGRSGGSGFSAGSTPISITTGSGTTFKWRFDFYEDSGTFYLELQEYTGGDRDKDSNYSSLGSVSDSTNKFTGGGGGAVGKASGTASAAGYNGYENGSHMDYVELYY